MEDRIIPQHVGIIMDGNGRWAKKRGLPRSMGHKQGAAVFKKTINWCRELGIKCATFYAFSTENWKRPADEVEGIMNLLRQYIRDIRKAADENIRIIIIGDISRFDDDIRLELEDIQSTSRSNTGFIVSIALNYGGRAELVKAMQELGAQIASGALAASDITEECIKQHLYTSEMPPLDLVIRPSGEQRLSNFLIWQAAYAEFVFMDVLWPDFSKKDLEYAVDAFASRNRRYGGI